MKRIGLIVVLMILLLQGKTFGQVNNFSSHDSVKVFIKFLQKNIHYPALDRENELTGRVFIAFKVINDVENGTHIVEIKKLRDSTISCGDEVVRVVKSYTGAALKPGTYSFSVDFVLADGDSNIINKSGELLAKDKPANFLDDIVIMRLRTKQKREVITDYEIIKPTSVVH